MSDDWVEAFVGSGGFDSARSLAARVDGLRRTADLLERKWPDEVGAQQSAVDLRRIADELDALRAGLEAAGGCA